MLKVLPVFVIFFLTGIFLLKVDNLTQKKNLNLSSNLNIEANLNSENQEETNLYLREYPIIEEQFKVEGIEKKIKDNTKNEESSENKNFDENLKIKESQKNKILIKKFSVQFGAFSKEVGAKRLKNKVDKIIKPKFDFFESHIQYNNKKKIYLVKFDSDSKENVNQTCKFSKSKEIDCYVLQQ